jgi:hypothetical protein
MKYYTGTIDLTFEQLDAENEEELYEKIEKYLPDWVTIQRINTEYYETEAEVRSNYVDDGAIERRLYDKN